MAENSEESTARNERYRKLLKDELLADVTFLVGKGKVPVKANKTILRFGSNIFCDMFDEKSKQQNVYEVPNLEPEEFRKFLEYLYTGELKSDFKDAEMMLKAAMLYDAKDVAARCVKQLTSTIGIDNCGSILSLAIESKSEELEDKSVTFICKYADKIFDSNSNNLNFSEAALLKIVPLDDLVVDELKLFEAIVKWGKLGVAKTSEANVENPKYIRSVLENFIKHIRFPLMDPSDFSTKVDPTELLTVEETVAVLLCFNVKKSERATYKARIFNSKPRDKKPKPRFERTCQYCDRIVAVGDAVIDIFDNDYGPVPLNGNWFCTDCNEYTD